MAKVTLEILSGPDYERNEDGWEHHAYTVQLRYEGRKMSTPWKQGLGITHDPNARDVLENLFLDASGYDNARDFEEWAENYGLDTDSRKALALYEACGKQARQLARLFGIDDAALAPWQNEDAEALARRYADAG